MKKPIATNRGPRARTVLLAGLLGAMQIVAAPARAATDLADIPMIAQVRAAPNLLMTLDNSGSMHWGFMPGTAIYQTNRACFFSAQFNTLFYDPKQDYLPGKHVDGSSYPKASFKKAYVDGYNLNAKYATTGVNAKFGENRFDSLGPLTTDTVDLSSSFQGSFGSMAHFREGKDTANWFWYVTKPEPAFYFVYKGDKPEYNKCYADSEYRKVVVTDKSGFDRHQDGNLDERENFANWFTYYRTRLVMLKTVLTQTFSGVDDHFRVGLSTINATTPDEDGPGQNDTGENFIPVDSFSGAHKNRWFDTVIGLVDGGSTPLVEALRKDGEYFRTGKMEGVNFSIPDPIPKAVESCQRNYTILATDGYWNDKTPASVPGNQDLKVPSLPFVDGLNGLEDNHARGGYLKPGQLFPPPFRDTKGVDFSLADTAMLYWVNNLRPGAKVPNAVPKNDLDPARWPHMQTFGISLGEGGTLENSDDMYMKIFNGTKEWPSPEGDKQTTMDDLWHAAINGHGLFVTAKDSTDLRTGIQKMLTEVGSATLSGGSLTVSSQILTDASHFAYAATYDPGSWSGDLSAYTIDQYTGDFDETPKARLWSAQALLDKRDWRTRAIATAVSPNGPRGVAGIPFEADKMPSPAQARLKPPGGGPDAITATQVVDFLRGSRALEVGTFRARLHVLGDIVGAESVYLDRPLAKYADAGYRLFASKHANRTKLLFQGANDGMLHAFDAVTGDERWAYVPGLLIDTPYVVALPPVNSPGTSSLLNLTSNTSFTHLPYVDATPAVGDVDLGHTNGGDGVQWATMLVGGLGKGGRGYYALDVTDVNTVGDWSSRLALWEFPQKGTAPQHRKNIGNTYGKPLIVKTSSGKWVVLVTSGYNNGSATGGDGRGHLFVLDARSGEVIRDIVTGAGSPAAPSGLAHISAYVEYVGVNNTTDFVYGGDLLGNLWRFDLRAAEPAQWNVRQLARLVDPSDAPQPITTVPELGKVDKKRMVYVGTGQYLGLSDIPGIPGSNAHASQLQTLYGLLDDESATPTIKPTLRSQLVRQSLKASGPGQTDLAATAVAVDLDKKKGWYFELPHAGERSVSSPTILRGTVSFTSINPSADPCLPGGSSWLYVLDYATGGAVADPDHPWAAHYLGATLFNRQLPIKTMSRKGSNSKFYDLARSSGATGKNVTAATEKVAPPIPDPALIGQRNLWREIMAK